MVEDEQSLRQLAGRILTGNGYQVGAVTTAVDALDQAGDLRQPIDLLLTDVVMPGILGNEVTRCRGRPLSRG
jgi:CheY-like chemotaxis protein